MEKSYKGGCITKVKSNNNLLCTSLMDCDMFLDAIHSFKIVYLHYKQNKHVHSLLVVLIKIYRNTVFQN